MTMVFLGKRNIKPRKFTHPQVFPSLIFAYPLHDLWRTQPNALQYTTEYHEALLNGGVYSPFQSIVLHAYTVFQ